MVPCVAIGDSIAVGVGQARPDCEIIAKVGITSGRYVATLLPGVVGRAGLAVISLGVNDGGTGETLENLRAVRARVRADEVVWLLPARKAEVRAMIGTVAAENGDRTLDTRGEVGPDGLHPTGAGYARLAVAASSGEEMAYAPEEPQGRGAGRHGSGARHLRAVGKAAKRPDHGARKGAAMRPAHAMPRAPVGSAPILPGQARPRLLRG